jgi:hypothetical protein
MQVRMRCHDVSEGREAILLPNGEDTKRTKVVSITACFWDDDIPKEIHTDRKRTCIFTTMVPSEFDLYMRGAYYTITIEPA